MKQVKDDLHTDLYRLVRLKMFHRIEHDAAYTLRQNVVKKLNHEILRLIRGKINTKTHFLFYDRSS